MAPKIVTKTATEGDVHVDMHGNVLDMADKEAVARAYSEAMLAVSIDTDNETLEAGEIAINQDQIHAIVSSIHGDGRKADVQKARLVALLRKNAEDAEPLPTVHVDASFSNKEAEAFRIGSSLSEITSEHLAAAVTGREKFDGAWLLVAGDLDDAAEGDKTVAELLSSAPYPGTYPSDSNNKAALPKGSNQDPDFQGKGNQRWSYWAKVFSQTAYGQRVDRIVEILDKAAAHNVGKDNPEPTDEEIEEFRKLSGEQAPLGGHALKNMASRWKGARNAAIQRLRLAQKFRVQRERFEALPNATWQFVEADAELCSTKKKPIQIVELFPDNAGKAGKPTQTASDPISLTEFLSYDIDKARRNIGKKTSGQALRDFLKTTRVERGNGGAKKSAIPARPRNAGETEELICSLIAMFEDTATRSQFAKWLNGQDSNANVRLIATLYNHVRNSFESVEERLRNMDKAVPKMPATNGKTKTAA